MLRVLDRYALHDVLGSGGMAQVHMGRLLGAVGVSRTVAIKRLHPHLASEPDFLAMFVDEARLATRIHHPNVVATLDVVAAEGELFVVMEYVHGEALSHLLPVQEGDGRERPTPAIVSSIVADVLHGLHAAHEAKDERGEPLGIVHRDVSPHNVLVGVDGSARIADFGVAKAAGRLHSTPGSEIKGKIAYLAPEQLRGEPVTRLTDVYATAVVLWQALAGRRLFPGDTPVEVMTSLAKRTIEPPSAWMGPAEKAKLGEATLRALDALTLRALSPSPSDRFATAREMAEALEACLPPAPRSRVGEWVERSAKEALARRALFITELEAETVPMSTGRVLAEVRSSSPAMADDVVTTRPDGSSLHPAAPPPLPETRGSRRVVPIAAGAAAIGVACVVGGWNWMATREARLPSDVAAAGSLDAGPPPRAMTDWPAPATSHADAADAYRAALQALRRGSDRDSRADLRRAIDLDPSMAAAHLRLALALRTTSGMDTERREQFKRAIELRDTLSDRDRALLAAFEPYLTRDPPDPRETARLLGGASERFRDDAELAFYLGLTEADLGEFADAVQALGRAAEIDPEFLAAWAQLAEAESYAGDQAEALRSVDHCLALSPIATDCAKLRLFVHRAAGDCVALEADARQMLAAGAAASDQAYFTGEAVASQDGDLALVEEAVARYARGAPPEERIRAGWLRMRYAMLSGDFTSVVTLAAELEQLTDGNPGLAAHANTNRWLVASLEESGATRAARDAAAKFVAHYPVWLPPPGVDDLGMHLDPLPWMLGAERRLGGASRAETEAQRDAWLDRWRRKASGGYVPFLWVHGYAMAVDDRDDADAALAALGDFAPLPPGYPDVIGDAYVGHVYLKAGRPADAEPFLRRASRTCFALAEPVDHTHAILDLASALEKNGEKADACAAYARILRRWGHAKPRSLSAETAEARTSALGCHR